MYTTISERVLGILEWQSILKELESRCATVIGKKLVSSLKPLMIERVRLRLKQITEIKELMIQSEAPDFAGITEIDALLEIASKEGVLSIENLSAIKDFIIATNRIINFISKFKDQLDNTAEEYSALNKLRDLGELLSNSITDSNELNVNRFKELKRIKENLFKTRQEIEKKLHDIIHSPHLSLSIQEKIHTIRNERYVVLVKSNMRDKVKGNLHDVSSSGATFFVEPAEIISSNNKLIMLERDYKNEILRILRELSKETGKYSNELYSNSRLLAGLDFLAAASKLSISIKGSEPEILDEPIIQLLNARHPLLYLMSTGTVIPNDISIGKDFNCMIISGANTGGKTVLLKTAGLCALLSMHGLHIPADPDSSIGIFSGIMADIGDDQSISASLSTYSGQIVIINEMIENANEETLVLIDEILVGTNPRQGAVLAQSVLESLAETGARIIATTHYPELKELPLANNRFMNASVSFDAESLKPTFKLRTGIPGTSYALDIAKNYGLRDNIIKRAKELLDSREKTAEALIENMQKHREELEEENRKISELNITLTKEKNKYLKMQADLSLRIEETKNEKGIEFIDEINKFRNEIANKIKDIHNAKESELEKLQQNLGEIKTKIIHRLKKDRKKRFIGNTIAFLPEKANTGDSVFIVSLEKIGKIESIDNVNSSVSVLLGNSIKAKYGFNDVLTPLTIAKKNKPQKTIIEKKYPVDIQEEKSDNEISRTIQMHYNTCDLRGLKVEEALNKLESDLDKMIRSAINTAVIIHGHGTGALKEAVRNKLKTSSYVKRFRPGEYGEGGDGVTIASL